MPCTAKSIITQRSSFCNVLSLMFEKVSLNKSKVSQHFAKYFFVLIYNEVTKKAIAKELSSTIAFAFSTAI